MNMETAVIKDAKYRKDIDSGKVTYITCIINNKTYDIPVNEPNRYLSEINKRVSTGTLTVEAAS